jgi:hypothetical protein
VEDVTGDRLFLLSPAFCNGRRAKILTRMGSEVPIAQRLQAGTLTLGEAFAFLSGLYFRGKLAYGTTFGRIATTGSATLVITPTRGLLEPTTVVTASMLREFASVDVAVDNTRYRKPLERDVATLAAALASDTAVVLLGSIATGKYVDVLAPAFGDRLRFPTSFIGRGDMSRGGLLLRSVDAGLELEYGPIKIGQRPRGGRPPKLSQRGTRG